MIGDFNEIIGHHEKQGGISRPDASFLPFKQMIQDCGMLEFPCSGNTLSWVGNQGRTRTCVHCRLDRALGYEDWHENFPHSHVQYLRLWASDHRSIVANILSKPVKARKTFCFNKRWKYKEGVQTSNEDSSDIRESIWTMHQSRKVIVAIWEAGNDCAEKRKLKMQIISVRKVE